MYIQFAPMPGKVNEIRRIANRVWSIQNEQERESASRAEPKHFRGLRPQCDQRHDECHVMTAAHALKHVYCWADPLTIEKARLFRALVVCYHHGEACRQAGLPLEARRYVDAKITASAWAYDILVLTVVVGALRDFHTDDVCPGPHPTLPVARSMPRAAMRCMLVAWPAVNGHQGMPWGGRAAPGVWK